MTRCGLKGMPLDRWQSGHMCSGWKKELMRPRNVTLPLREDRTDYNGEGPCNRTSPRISRDQPT